MNGGITLQTACTSLRPSTTTPSTSTTAATFFDHGSISGCRRRRQSTPSTLPTVPQSPALGALERRHERRSRRHQRPNRQRTLCRQPERRGPFYDIAYSPDGQYLAVAGNSDFYIVNTTSQAATWSVTNPPAAVNAIAWSPDGNYISRWMGRSSASSDMYQFGNNAWNRIWQKTTTTSRATPPSPQTVLRSFRPCTKCQGDGATARAHYWTPQSSLFVQRPPSWRLAVRNNNQCGVMYVVWSPDSNHIVTAHGRNDEGVYYWFANIDEDNDGYNTTDQGDGIVDAFPSDGTQWNDTDATASETIQHQPTNPMLVQTHRASTEDRLAVLTRTETDGPTQETGTRSTPTSGWMRTRTVRRQLPV